MKKNSIMQKDFEKVLKSMSKNSFVAVPSSFGDWWYSFAFGGNIYLALYSHGADPFIRINKEAGMNDDAIYDLCNFLNESIGCEANLSSLGLSKTYYVGGSSDGKYLYINID